MAPAVGLAADGAGLSRGVTGPCYTRALGSRAGTEPPCRPTACLAQVQDASRSEANFLCCAEKKGVRLLSEAGNRESPGAAFCATPGEHRAVQRPLDCFGDASKAVAGITVATEAEAGRSGERADRSPHSVGIA